MWFITIYIIISTILTIIVIGWADNKVTVREALQLLVLSPIILVVMSIQKIIKKRN